jgi:hypothetical protein
MTRFHLPGASLSVSLAILQQLSEPCEFRRLMTNKVRRTRQITSVITGAATSASRRCSIPLPAPFRSHLWRSRPLLDSGELRSLFLGILLTLPTGQSITADLESPADKWETRALTHPDDGKPSCYSPARESRVPELWPGLPTLREN